MILVSWRVGLLLHQSSARKQDGFAMHQALLQGHIYDDSSYFAIYPLLARQRAYSSQQQNRSKKENGLMRCSNSCLEMF